MAHTGDVPRATTVAEGLAKAAKESRDGTLFHGAGTIYAVCSDVVQKQPAVKGEDREEAVKKYAALAVGMLHQAREAGHYNDPKGLERLLKDQNLDSIRARDDFKQLLKAVQPESAGTR